MKIYLVRHGEVEHNRLGIYSTENEDLNDTGVIQASNLKEIIDTIDYDVLFTSPLKRTVSTSNIINNKNKKIVTDDLLIERSPGDLNGKPLSCTDRNEYWNYNTSVRYGTEEDIKLFVNRIFKFIDNLKGMNYNAVLIVAHSGVSKVFNMYFNGVGDGYLLNKGLKNCELIEYMI